MSMFNRVRETQEIRAAMWPLGGKSEEDARTAIAEKTHAGDYAAACRRIAQLEITLQDVEDQHADLKHAYDLAQGTANLLAQKGEKAPSVDQVEHVLQMNRQFGTDPATDAFESGQAHPQRKAANARHKEDAQIKESIKAWYTLHRNEYDLSKDCIVAVRKYALIGQRKAEDYLREWEKETGFTQHKNRAPKVPKK